MPTLSLSYLLLPNHRNLWKEPAASILDPRGLHHPPDPVTGEANEESRDQKIADQVHIWAISRTTPTHVSALSGRQWCQWTRHHARHFDAHGAGIAGSPGPYSTGGLGGGHEQLLRTVWMA